MDSVKNASECLAEKLSHSYQFVSAENGQIMWVCQLCGYWLHDFEDSLP